MKKDDIVLINVDLSFEGYSRSRKNCGHQDGIPMDRDIFQDGFWCSESFRGGHEEYSEQEEIPGSVCVQQVGQL